MKPTGIVRRIDDLGRIVIPKEIRRKLFGKDNVEGQPLEFFLDKEGFIVLKPYRATNEWEPIVNPHGELTEFICSCGCSSQRASSYCPDCGTKMDNSDIEKRIQKALSENGEMRVFGLEQSNYEHLYRWIFTEKSLLEQGVEPHDKDCKDILFPIGGSNSSSTFFVELHTKEEVKNFLLGDYNTDYDDPMLVDIAEGIITINTEDECYGAITSQYVKLFSIPEDELTKENSLMAQAKKMIEEIQETDKTQNSGIDYKNPFYGKSRDMRLSKLKEIHDKIVTGKEPGNE